MSTAQLMLPPGISVVVPVYNSEKTLDELAQRLHELLAGLKIPFELILVNDNSRDQSWRVINQLVERYPWVQGIDLMRNFGQHNALLCGIRSATYDTLVTMDDDLQNPPQEIPKLLALLKEGHDVVYGTPAAQQHGLLRDLASQLTKLVLQGAMGAATARKISAFRAFRTQLREAFDQYRSPYVSLDVLLTWGTTRFTAVTVQHHPREVGRSNYTVRKLLTHALNMVTGFSILPLQLAGLVGFSFALFGMAVLAYVLGRYAISGTTVAGFPFLASIIAIFSGAQMFALGIIGEYLARMHLRLMERPAYTIRQHPPTSRSSAAVARLADLPTGNGDHSQSTEQP
jgi:glycosyltransferase involved in cell wall biosynthesis